MEKSPDRTDAMHAKNYANYPLPDDPELAALISHLLDEILWLNVLVRHIWQDCDDAGVRASQPSREWIVEALQEEGGDMGSRWSDFYLPIEPDEVHCSTPNTRSRLRSSA